MKTKLNLPWFKEKRARIELEQGYAQAQELIREPDKMERFLQKLEQKLKQIPLLGREIKELPILLSLLRNYFKKEYQEVPVGTLLAVVSALIYFLSPIDGLPDFIPLFGYSDDAVVLGICWKLVQSDLKDYMEWRKTHYQYRK